MQDFLVGLSYWLMEIGAWILSFALTFGLFCGLLWLGAYLMGGKK